jgi:hypothetical protein
MEQIVGTIMQIIHAQMQIVHGNKILGAKKKDLGITILIQHAWLMALIGALPADGAQNRPQFNVGIMITIKQAVRH